jgi:hypothetical protein
VPGFQVLSLYVDIIYSFCHVSLRPNIEKKEHFMDLTRVSIAVFRGMLPDQKEKVLEVDISDSRSSLRPAAEACGFAAADFLHSDADFATRRNPNDWVRGLIISPNDHFRAVFDATSRMCGHEVFILRQPARDSEFENLTVHPFNTDALEAYLFVYWGRVIRAKFGGEFHGPYHTPAVLQARIDDGAALTDDEIDALLNDKGRWTGRLPAFSPEHAYDRMRPFVEAARAETLPRRNPECRDLRLVAE